MRAAWWIVVVLAGCPRALTDDTQDTGPTYACGDVRPLADLPGCDGGCTLVDDVCGDDWSSMGLDVTPIGDPVRNQCRTVTNETLDTLSVQVTDRLTRLWYLRGDDVVGGLVLDDDATCPQIAYGRSLETCTPVGTLVTETCEPDTGDSGDDTDSDPPAGPTYCGVSPFSSSGWCDGPGGLCVRFIDVTSCPSAYDDLVLFGSCDAGAVSTEQVVRLVDGDGVIDTLYFNANQQLVTVTRDLNDGGCIRTWGDMAYTACDADEFALTLAALDCHTDVDTGDTDDTDDTDTAPVDTSWDGSDPRPAWTLGAGDLAITELLLDPEGCGNSVGQYVELVNLSGDTISLEGLRLVQGGTLVGPIDPVSGGAAAPFAPGARIVAMPAGPGCHDFGDPADARWGTGPILSTTGSDLTLETPAGVVLDRVDTRGWRFGAGTVTPPGVALVALTETAVGNDDADDWCLATQTLGTLNAGTPGTTGPGTGGCGTPDTGDTDTDTDTSMPDTDPVDCTMSVLPDALWASCGDTADTDACTLDTLACTLAATPEISTCTDGSGNDWTVVHDPDVGSTWWFGPSGLATVQLTDWFTDSDATCPFLLAGAPVTSCLLSQNWTAVPSPCDDTGDTADTDTDTVDTSGP